MEVAWCRYFDSRHQDCCSSSPSTLWFPPPWQAFTNTSVGLHVYQGARVLAEDCDFICRNARCGPTDGAMVSHGAHLTLQR
jgi:hypothetical protein